MEIRTYDASSVFDAGFLEEYKQGMQLFYSELVNLNTNIFIFKKINEFPFRLFCKSTDTIFFTSVLKNLYDISILTITRLVTDTAGDLSTLLQFKNQIVKSSKPEFKEALLELLKKSKFDSSVGAMLETATKIRNTRIAHLKIETIFSNQISNLKIDELERIVQQLNSLLQAVSFNVEQLLLPLPYSGYVKQSTDIEKILDNMVFNSNLINMPETVPIDAWERFKKKLSQTDVEILNKYRKKFELTQV